MRSEKKLRVYTASEAKGLILKIWVRITRVQTDLDKIFLVRVYRFDSTFNTNTIFLDQ